MFSRIDELEERVRRLEAVVFQLIEGTPSLDTARVQAMLETLRAPIVPTDD